MKWLFLFLLTPLILHAADEDNTWPKPVNGLQARLVISPLEKGDDGHPHFVLSLQLRRKDNLGVSMQVSYSPGSIPPPPDAQFDGGSTLVLHVIDQNDKEWPREGLVAGDQIEGPWSPLILPPGAFLSFPIGSSMRQGAGDRLGEYLEFHFWNQWRIPPPSSMIYYLTGTFTITAASKHNSSVFLPTDSSGNEIWN